MTVVEAIRAWRLDSARFVREVFGVEPDAWQLEVLKAWDEGHQQIAMNACKGPGKSCLLAWIIWHFLLTRPHPKVIATSITGKNLEDGLWSELSKWRVKSEILMKLFTQRAERIVANDHPETWFCSARSWAKTATVEEQADTLAGIHGDYILFVLDEAGGIPDTVSASAEAALSTGIECRMIIAGNPTKLEGPLYRASTTDAKHWWVVNITGDPDDALRSPRIDIGWARRQIEKYGKDSAFVQVNVFGNFPRTQENKLLGPDDVREAMERVCQPHEYNQEPRILGIDIARFGTDRTVFFPRQGKVAMIPEIHRSLDSDEVAGSAALFIDRWKPDAVFLDVGGIGTGVYDRLKRLQHTAIIPISFGGRPHDMRYENKRAEMFWDMCDWVKREGNLPGHIPELVADLTGPEYDYQNKRDKFQLESKISMKKRGMASPDLADALCLTFAEPVATRRTIWPNQPHQRRAVYEYDPVQTWADSERSI